jgi:hypothetical protein
MRAVINGKRYDTSSAVLIGEAGYCGPKADLQMVGGWPLQNAASWAILYCRGGQCNDPMGQRTSNKGRIGGFGIFPMERDEALEWAENYLTPEQVEAGFAVVMQRIGRVRRRNTTSPERSGCCNVNLVYRVVREEFWDAVILSVCGDLEVFDIAGFGSNRKHAAAENARTPLDCRPLIRAGVRSRQLRQTWSRDLVFARAKKPRIWLSLPRKCALAGTKCSMSWWSTR